MKLGFKDIMLIILTLVVVISILTQGRNVRDKKNEIRQLQLENKNLILLNDSLIQKNKKIDKDFDDLVSLLEEQENKLVLTQMEIDRLKKRKNEIPNYVNYLSANDIANEFSTYINKNRGSSSNRN